MATPLSGRYASVRIGGTVTSAPAGGGSIGTVIGNLGHWEIAISFDELDASVFGSVWKKSMTGMQQWSGTVEGFFDTSTAANAQILGLLNPALDATLIQDIRFYLQTSSGLFFMPNYTSFGTTTSTDDGAYISNVRISHDKTGLASASYNVLGYGELALFQGAVITSSAIIVEGA